MKSETSFFNFGIFRKNLTRFFPLWLVYTIGMSLVFMATGIHEWYEGYYTWGLRDVMSWLPVTAFFNACYGLCCGVTLFYDLFNARRCNALHAMPLKRECWFCTNVLSGLTFGLIPNLTVTILMMAKYPQASGILLLFLLGTLLQFFVFFGITVFVVMLTGNAMGTVLITGFLCLFSLLCYAFVQELYVPLLWGVEGAEDPFLHFSPIGALVSGNYYDPIVNGPFFSEGWAHLLVYAALSAILLVAALQLYRKRALECAGDFLAFRVTGPALIILVTPLCGSLLYAFFDVFGAANYTFLFIGMGLVYFVLQMLLERTSRVFHLKSILGFAALCIAVGVSLYITQLDPLGIESYIPDSKEIVAVQLDKYYNNSQDSTPEYIEVVRNLHAAVLADEDYVRADDESSEYVSIIYTLRSGRKVERSYRIGVRSNAAKQYAIATSRRESVFGKIDYYRYAQDPTYTKSVNGVDIADEVAVALLDAIGKDCDAGHMGQVPGFDDWQGTWLYLEFEAPYNPYYVAGEPGKPAAVASQDLYFDVYVPSNAENTWEILYMLGIYNDNYDVRCGVEG